MLNGAGKTTLLSLLASFAEPDEGAIRVNRQPLFENAGLMQRVTFVYEGERPNPFTILILTGLSLCLPHFSSGKVFILI